MQVEKKNNLKGGLPFLYLSFIHENIHILKKRYFFSKYKKEKSKLFFSYFKKKNNNIEVIHVDFGQLYAYD